MVTDKNTLKNTTDDDENDNTPPPVWYESSSSTPRSDIPPTLRNIRCDERLVSSAGLPSISAPNLRSLSPKINNFVQDLKMRQIGLALGTETWNRDEKKKHQYEVEKMVQMEGLQTLSINRKMK